MTASDIRMQLVVICNLNLPLQLVTINFTFSLLRIFTLAHVLHNVRVLLHRFPFWSDCLSHALQDYFYREIITKHNIQKKTHIHCFHNNKLLGELTAIRQLFLNFNGLIRIVLEPTL